MGRPSKFTAPARAAILEELTFGASRRTAAARARIGHQTLARWLERGRDAPEGSPWREFLLDVEQAEAAPRSRALRIFHREMDSSPAWAWKFIERREPGFAPPVPNAPGLGTAPVLIQLSLHEGALPQLGEGQIIEGEAVEEPVTA